MSSTINAVSANSARELTSLTSGAVANHGGCRRGCNRGCRRNCRRGCRRSCRRS